MKNSTVTITFEDEKLSAVRRYMKKKDTDLDEELAAQLLRLYEKYVPAGVQEYIAEREAEDVQTPKKRQKVENGDTE